MCVGGGGGGGGGWVCVVRLCVCVRHPTIYRLYNVRALLVRRA